MTGLRSLQRSLLNCGRGENFCRGLVSVQLVSERWLNRIPEGGRTGSLVLAAAVLRRRGSKQVLTWKVGLARGRKRPQGKILSLHSGPFFRWLVCGFSGLFRIFLACISLLIALPCYSELSDCAFFFVDDSSRSILHRRKSLSILSRGF